MGYRDSARAGAGRRWLLIGLLAFLAWRQWTARRGAAWVPTARQDVRRMLALADVQPDELVYDLGSGDGRVLLAATGEFGARGVGIELDPVRVAWSRARLAAAGRTDRAVVHRADLFRIDLSDADVVVVYLMQWSTDVLAEKLSRELRPGTRIVSHHWTLPGFELVEAAEHGKLLLYRA
jgi:SAM-dependent methyltransferase